MEKKEVLNLLLDYHNGHLDKVTSDQVEDALNQDPELKAQYNLVQRELMLIRGGKADQFEDLRYTQISEKVMKDIRESKKRGFAGLSPIARSYMGASFVVVVIIIVLILFFVFRPEKPAEIDPGKEVESVEEVTVDEA